MESKITTILIFFGLVSLAISQTCNSTHMQFFSEYYLGRQDELNITFTKIQQKVSTLNNVSWKLNDTTTYRIVNIKPRFFYIDSRQRAQITGNDTVVIEGGRLDVRMDFEWVRQGLGSLSGTGTANAVSDEITFAMQLKIEKGFLLQILYAYQNVTFSHFGINITKIDPPTTPQTDLINLKRLLNDIINVTTVRHELQDEIDKYFNFYLNQSLYDNRRIIDEYYEYVWNGSKGKFVVPLSVNATYVDIEKVGVTLMYIAKIQNYSDWKCQYNAPSLHWNPQVYGGVQQFITYDVYKNILKYAIDKGQLDADLTRRDWQSRFFQFYAGDLYEIIPKVSEKFIASEVVTGSCKTSTRNLEFKKGGYDFLNVTLVYNCEIGITRDKVAEFQVNMTLMVEGRPNQTAIDFHVIHTDTHNVTLIPYLDYKIANKDLALHMIAHSIGRLVGHRTFGSGWKLYQRDYPHFITEDHYSVVYDSTHVDPHTPIHQKEQ